MTDARAPRIMYCWFIIIAKIRFLHISITKSTHFKHAALTTSNKYLKKPDTWTQKIQGVGILETRDR